CGCALLRLPPAQEVGEEGGMTSPNHGAALDAERVLCYVLGVSCPVRLSAGRWAESLWCA
ncbi:MAG TPA: hypothetical protein VNT26_02045, partial [Candidatus Sulfotelmatobacter sp.]|nr:hypothetical protein [Candidatus Sulfotelmatobacter sp.]